MKNLKIFSALFLVFFTGTIVVTSCNKSQGDLKTSSEKEEVITSNSSENTQATTRSNVISTYESQNNFSFDSYGITHNGICLFVTEYGLAEASGGGSLNIEESKTWWNFLDTNHISWCNWSIADKEELSAALQPGASGNGGWTEGQLTTSGKAVRDEILEKN